MRAHGAVTERQSQSYAPGGATCTSRPMLPCEIYASDTLSTTRKRALPLIMR
jgi:hypothetical protein